MKTLNERLDELRHFIQKDVFLDGKGLSNEVNIRLFCYDAQDEIVVQHFLSQLLTDQTLRCRLIACNLFQIFLSICDELGIMEAIPEMEEADGGYFLLEQLRSAIRTEEFVEKLRYSPHTRGDVLLLTGVGDVFPFMRVHVLLEAMQPYFSDMPVLVMYPGKFDGHQMRLFDRLQPNDYYRAFNIIGEG